MGAEWAKVDMIKLLPVERVLYLDSDVLVRVDLRQLWNIDLQGKAIGGWVSDGPRQSRGKTLFQCWGFADGSGEDEREDRKREYGRERVCGSEISGPRFPEHSLFG